MTTKTWSYFHIANEQTLNKYFHTWPQPHTYISLYGLKSPPIYLHILAHFDTKTCLRDGISMVPVLWWFLYVCFFANRSTFTTDQLALWKLTKRKTSSGVFSTTHSRVSTHMSSCSGSSDRVLNSNSWPSVPSSAAPGSLQWWRRPWRSARVLWQNREDSDVTEIMLREKIPIHLYLYHLLSTAFPPHLTCRMTWMYKLFQPVHPVLKLIWFTVFRKRNCSD